MLLQCQQFLGTVIVVAGTEESGRKTVTRESCGPVLMSPGRGSAHLQPHTAGAGAGCEEPPQPRQHSQLSLYSPARIWGIIPIAAFLTL